MKRSSDRFLTLKIVSLLRAAAPQVFSAQVNATAAKELQGLIQATPELQYPIAAGARHITDHGVFDAWFRTETGGVTYVNILCSTGSKPSDDAVVKGLSRWRARPRTVSHMQIPVSFVM